LLLVVGCNDPAVPAGATETDDATATVTATGTSTTTMGTSPTSGASTGDSADTGETADASSDGGGTNCGEDEPPPPGVTECGNACGSNPFDVEHLSAINYDFRTVHILSPACSGPACPSPFSAGTYRDEAVGPCEETAEAIASPRGPEEYCKLSPLALSFGIEIGFTQSPDPESITVERPRPENPNDTEAYVWRSGIVELRGPSTRFNGDYARGAGGAPDIVTNARNLTCIENLEAEGIPYDPDDLETPCNATFDDDGTTTPLRMRVGDPLRPRQGRLDSRTVSCSTPDTGPDTCCSVCDFELSVNVAKYGVAPGGTRLSPNVGTALACDPKQDRLASCRDFRPHVDRSRELVSYRYDWDGCLQNWPLPLYDKVRQTHPDDRPDGVDIDGPACDADDDCGSGQECVGTNAAGEACKSGGGCSGRRCIAEWFVGCRRTVQSVFDASFCVDTRFRDQVAGACQVATASFDGIGGMQPAGTRLVQCDTSQDGVLSPGECCQASLGDEETCDPLFQGAVDPLVRHDRDASIPNTARCYCDDPDGQPGACASVIESSCEPPVGNGTDPGGGSLPDAYAQRSVTGVGGTRYDAELDGFELLLAHRGNEERSLTESCAESAGLIGRRTVADGWIANETFITSFNVGYDVAMCSGSTYVLAFAGPDDPEHVSSTAGDTLGGKQRYTFETVDFLVVPGSGFPPNNLLVNACDEFSLRFSNKFDLSTDNQRKISIWELEDQGGELVPVQQIAGGSNCDPDATAMDVQMGAIPCLVVDLGAAYIGEIAVHIDHDVYGQLLQPGTNYRIQAPGLDDPADITNAAAYEAAFHDACGMPLITGDLPEPEYTYDVLVDVDCMP
jgi:hypothetical protein